MEVMKLFNYYSLDECTDKKLITKHLKALQKEGKIEFELEKVTDIFEIEDLDLEDADIEELLQMFEEYDVYPYLDKEEDEDDDEDYGYYDNEGDYDDY